MEISKRLAGKVKSNDEECKPHSQSQKKLKGL